MAFFTNLRTYPASDSTPHGGSWPGDFVGYARFTTWPNSGTGPGGYPSTLSFPGVVVLATDDATGVGHALARDLAATVEFDLPAGYGYRVERTAGASMTPHWLPGSGGWTLADEDTADAGGSASVSVALPTNDDDYTAAIWAIDPDGRASEPITVTVFGLNEPAAGPGGPRYASIQVTTARAGWPRIEVDTDPAFGSPTVYDAETDPGGWTICDTTGEVTSDAGDVMPAGGFPAGSSGKYLRVRLPAAFGNRYARGYQGSEPTP